MRQKLTPLPHATKISFYHNHYPDINIVSNKLFVRDFLVAGTTADVSTLASTLASAEQ